MNDTGVDPVDCTSKASKPFVITKHYKKGGLRKYLDKATNAARSMQEKENMTVDAARGICNVSC